MHMRRNHISLFFLVLSLLIHYADSALGADVANILGKVRGELGARLEALTAELKLLNAKHVTAELTENQKKKAIADKEKEVDATNKALIETARLQGAATKPETRKNMEKTHFYIPRELGGSLNSSEIPPLINKRAFVDTSMFDLTMLREDGSKSGKQEGGALLFMPWAGPNHGIAKAPIDSAKWQKWYNDNKQLNTDWANDRYASFKMASNVETFPFGQWTTDHYLSYDEMQLAALMIVAGPANFHSNCGDIYERRLYEDGMYVKKGYIVGAVGPRLEIPGIMDWAMMVPTHFMTKDGKPAQDPHSATRQKIYGVKEMPDPNEKCSCCEDYFWWKWNTGNAEQTAKKLSFLSPENKEWIFYHNKGRVPVHKFIYQRRMNMTYGAYLDFVYRAMVEERTEDPAKKAYVTVLSLGGGVWSLNPELQGKLVWTTIRDLIEDRGYAGFIHTLHFIACGWTAPDGDWRGIKINKTPMGPAQKVGGDDNTVRFYVYPWDSNALPGNEWWMPASSSWPGMKDGRQVPTLVPVWQASGDPAAACCSDIIYTQNWVENPHLAKEGDAISLKPELNSNQHVREQVRAMVLAKIQNSDARRLQTKQENAEEEEMKIDRELLTSGLSSYSIYSVVLVTVILATAMFIVSFFCVVV